MADQIITELPIKQQSGFNLNSYLLGLDADSYRILISDLAKKIVEDYSGSTLAGSAQAVKTALDSIDSTIGNTAMETTATTLTGAIAEHESDISQLNSNLDHLVKLKTVSYEYSIPANGNLTITGSQMGVDAWDSGYTHLAIRGFSTGNNTAMIRTILGNVGSGTMAILHNIGSSTTTGTLTLVFVLIKSSFV